MKKFLLLFAIAGLFLNVSAVKKVAYINYQKTMDATATTVQNDPIIQMLSADANFAVTVKIAATATDVISDLADYDVIIVQEAFSSSAGILKAGGSLALATMPKPVIYNKTYALRNGLAVGTSTATAADVAQLSVTVLPTALTNDLFKGCTIGANNEIVLFNAGATDLGAAGTKSLNYAKGNVVSNTGTLLAQPTTITDAVFAINDVPAGTTIDAITAGSRMITMNMNFGAICATSGANITASGLTIWKNAVYILAGLPIPVSGVSGVNETSAIVSQDYFSLHGVKVINPERGLYIRRTTYENGNVVADKVMLTEKLNR